MPDTKSTRILLLDDDPFMLRLMVRMLARLDYTRVLACDSGEWALQAIAEPYAAIDVIFLDINMPGMDGVEFIRRLVECRYEGSVVLVSGESDRILDSIEKLISAHRLQALGRLQKPVKPEELRALLEHLEPTARRRQQRAVSDRSYDAGQLRAAITHGELVNYYQPKVSLATGEVVGVESLVRWQHPTDGLIYPDRFIGLAADSGLIGELTRVVLRNSLQQARLWCQRGHQLSIAVNVSMDDLTALDFPDYAAAQAAQCGVEPEQVTLEITEGQVMRQLSVALDVISRLRLKRFRLGIDDFGTGHSSLAQLRDLPFDELKVDRSFVHHASSDPTLQAICSASLRMAQQLRLQTVAEGIEERGDWNLLCQLGCDVGQGYLIARPMPAGQLEDWMEGWGARKYPSIALGR